VKRLAAPALAALGLTLAWHLRFVQDDAFISFQYARALVEGQGLTWFGDRVEGYTNFLWVLWLALGLQLGTEPIAWSYLGGFLAFAAVLHAVWRLGGLMRDRAAAGFALALLVTNASVLAFATGGLETMLQTCILSQAALRLARLEMPEPRASRQSLELSLLAGIAVLVRPDSALPAGILLGGALWLARRDGARRLLALVVPAAAVVGAYAAWKIAYYGGMLPNTFGAKVAWSRATVQAGALYLWRYLQAYALWPALALGIVLRLTRPRPSTRLPVTWTCLLVAVLSWTGYLVAVGGDFMEFRMLVPISPFLFVILVLLLGPDRRGRALATGVVAAVLAAASLHHALTFRSITRDRRLDSVPMLATCYGLYPGGDWDAIGRPLGARLAGSGATIALHAVGAIPYYSRLPTVDMFGLNDRQVVRTGHRAPPGYRRPGHQRQVRLSDLRRRGVNLVLGHPTLLPPGALADPSQDALDAEWVREILAFGDEPIGPATLVLVPIERDAGLLAWYLTPSPSLDALVRAGRWETATLEVWR
jgi:arabinofuranosyltransferase